MKALLALEDGRSFPCQSFTGPGEAGGEVVFNTGMSGYQEVLTDPSYRGQLVTMTYPLVGSYGTNRQDMESLRIQVGAFLIRHYQRRPSNFRSKQSLADFLASENVLGIHDFDTRALARHIRTQGAMRACISTENLDPKSLADRANSIPQMAGQDLASQVTTQTPYFWSDGGIHHVDKDNWPRADIWQQKGKKPCVVALDFGIKFNILRWLEEAGCQVLVVPSTTSADVIRELDPDGVFLSNGPGDPEPVQYAVSTIADLLDYRPIFGICLGIQLLGLALGGRTYKLKFGHRGINQPVKNLATGKVEVTSQNHGFAVDMDSLPAGEVLPTHINLNDQTLEGFRHKSLPVFAVQYHPEASPGPHDARYLFDEYVSAMKR